MTTNITTDPSGTITTIDLGYRGCPEHVGAFLVRTSDGPVLVECGPAHCLPALTHGLEQAGTALEDIRHLFLTHIHLDHAGATGACTKAGAQAHVHPRGARHLVDPSQLMGSARRVFGAFLDTYLGCLEASDDSMVDPVEDQQVIDVGTARFTAIETPGHARHHHAWLAEIDGTRHLFSGDVAGMRLPGTDFVTLPLVAPELDTATWLD
jgi:glyoxylase-like metal-dependent hydrolase (beta-lactamase superfamily II)